MASVITKVHVIEYNIHHSNFRHMFAQILQYSGGLPKCRYRQNSSVLLGWHCWKVRGWFVLTHILHVAAIDQLSVFNVHNVALPHSVVSISIWQSYQRPTRSPWIAGYPGTSAIPRASWLTAESPQLADNLIRRDEGLFYAFPMLVWDSSGRGYIIFL